MRIQAVARATQLAVRNLPRSTFETDPFDEGLLVVRPGDGTSIDPGADWAPGGLDFEPRETFPSYVRADYALYPSGRLGHVAECVALAEYNLALSLDEALRSGGRVLDCGETVRARLEISDRDEIAFLLVGVKTWESIPGVTARFPDSTL